MGTFTKDGSQMIKAVVSTETTPTPHSLATLGSVKSTLDEELQLNTGWFADSALLCFHAEPTAPSLFSSPMNLSSSLPPLSCSSKIPLPSNTRKEVTKFGRNPTFRFMFSICSLLIVRSKSFNEKTQTLVSRPEPEMCMFTGSPQLPKQKWKIHSSIPDCDVSSLDEWQRQGNGS